MSKDPKVEAALEAARIKAEVARSRFPGMHGPLPIDDDNPPPRSAQAQANGMPDHMTPPAPPAPAPTPGMTGGLQTASYDALLREIERRKQEAVKQLQELQIQPQMLEIELKLRNLPADVRDKLKEIPTDVIVEELGLLKQGSAA